MRGANDNGFRLSYTVKEACEATGLGVTTIYELIKAGRLRCAKPTAGGRRWRSAAPS